MTGKKDKKPHEELEEFTFMDVVSMPVGDTSLSSRVVPFSRDANGYLRGTAIIGRAGVQTYRTRDGKEIRFLRRETEISKQDSLDTMKLLPMSKGHPPKNFTPKTIRGKQVGSVGENVEYENGRVFAPLIITEESAQKGALDGSQRELSIGYKAKVLREPGTWEGQPYDAEQIDIRGNHVALVKRARAGADAAVEIADGEDFDFDEATFEGCDAVLMDAIDSTIVFADEDNHQHNEGGQKMPQFKLKNGQVVEADQQFIDEHTAILEENGTLDQRVKDLEADVKAKDIELKDAADAEPSDDDIAAAAKDLLAVRSVATDAGVDFADSDSAIVLKNKVCAAIMDTEFKDDDVADIESHFKASQKLVIKRKEKSKSNRQKVRGEFHDDDSSKLKGAKEKKKGKTGVQIQQEFHDSLYSAHEEGNQHKNEEF